MTASATRRTFLAGGSAALVAGAAPLALRGGSAWAKAPHDVIIIGAGLAGLHAAALLEAAGRKVRVIEGLRRVGGRLHTLDDLPGAPEAGGIQIGTGYHRLRAIAAGLGVALDDGPGGGAGAVEAAAALFHVRGRTVSAADWAASPANQTAAAERAVLPLALARHYGRALPGLAGPAAWADADPALDVSYGEALRRAGASAEAIRLIDANFNGNSVDGMSALSIARTMAVYRAGPGPIATVRGGSQRLAEAMAAALAGRVGLGMQVRGIEEEAGRVRVMTDQGSLIAAQVICTIPFSALRTIPLITPLPPPAAQMVAALPYTRASFAFISARHAFWRDDGLPPTLWTDDPLIGRVFVASETPPLLKTWAFDTGAAMLDRMTPAQAAAAIIPRLEAMRPAAKGQLRVERVVSWQNNPGARGIYHHIGTGQAAALAATVRHQGRRLHFAGEHLALAATGMEGALESGERAAAAVLAQE